jgi:hypothetical protein
VSIAGGWAPQDNYAAIVLVNPASDSAPLELSATVVPDTPRRVSLIDTEGLPLLGASVEGLNFDRWDPRRPLRAASFVLNGLHPNRGKRITFIKDDRRLVGFLLARGDGDAPYMVRMQPWGTVTGRIVDENGDPAKVVLSSGNGNVPNADPEVGEFHDLHTDPDGRFKIERLVPGQRYTARIYRDFRLRGFAFDKLILNAGEVRDVGNRQIQSSPDVKSASNVRALDAQKRAWRGTRIATKREETDEGKIALHNAVSKVFAADPPAPQARTNIIQGHIAGHGYTCIGYYGPIESVTPNEDGWKAVIRVSPHITGRGIPFTTLAIVEEWQIGKDGSLKNLSCKADSKTGLIMSD